MNVMFDSAEDRRKFQEWSVRTFSDLQGVKDAVVLAFVVALPDGRTAVAHGGDEGLLSDVMREWLDGRGVVKTVQNLVPPA